MFFLECAADAAAIRVEDVIDTFVFRDGFIVQAVYYTCSTRADSRLLRAAALSGWASRQAGSGRPSRSPASSPAAVRDGIVIR